LGLIIQKKGNKDDWSTFFNIKCLSCRQANTVKVGLGPIKGRPT